MTSNDSEKNRRVILSEIRAHGPITRQALARNLALSLPTVGKHLADLKASGAIIEDDPERSTGGRRAQTYVCNNTAHVAIGVSMRTTELTMVAVNLAGDVVEHRSRTLLYRNTDSYYRRMGEAVTEFVDELGATVLGVGFVVTGLVSPDGKSVRNGSETVTLRTLSQGIDLPTLMIRHSQARTMTELWLDPQLVDAVAIYLDRRPSGAVIANGALYQGAMMGNGHIEHMMLVPNGKPCYCGRNGCMGVQCSPEALMEDGESLPGFFGVLEQGELEHRERFEHWLGNIAQAIANIRAVLAGDIIIGGEAVQYLDNDDISRLHDLVRQMSSPDETEFALRLCLAPEHPCEIGAALRFIQPYVRG